jgi:Ni,Fe-hydrogenase III large subunit
VSILKKEKLHSEFLNVAVMNHCTQKEYFQMLTPFSYEEIMAMPLYTPRLIGNRSASVLSLIQQATFLDGIP